MARLFDDSSSEYLEIASAVVATVPLTMACWFRSDSATTEQALMSLADASATNNYYVLTAEGTDPGDPILARARPVSSGNGKAFSTSGYSINTWHHAAGVFTSTTSRAAFIDGGNKGTNSDTQTTSDIDTTSIARIGDSSPGDHLSGNVAEAALWNVALTEPEVAILAVGYSPLFVRPQSLVAYWPLLRDEDQDRVGGFDMTAFNTPSIATHPPVIYPAPISYLVPAVVAATRRIFITHT